MSVPVAWATRGRQNLSRVSANRELDLLLGVAAARVNPDARLTCPATIDWQRLEVLLHEHALLPAMMKALPALRGAAPVAWLAAVQASAAANARSALARTGELLQVLEAFRERGIRAIPYKGPVLAAALYGDVAQRDFLDLDVLVSKPDLAPCIRLLAERGYRSAALLTDAEEQRLLRFDCERAFLSSDTAVELHWAIAPSQFSVKFDFDELWKRTRQIAIGGSTVAHFSDEDLLLVLAVHAAKHAWSNISWVVDIAQLLHTTTAIDWPSVFERARRNGLRRVVGISLVLAESIGCRPLPEPARRFTNDPALPAIVARIVESWANGGIQNRHERHVFLMRARERTRDRIRYAWRLITTPGLKEWSLVRLPASLAVLYLPLRLARVTREFLRRK